MIENLADAGAATAIRALVPEPREAARTTAAAEHGRANMLMATKKSSWRRAAKPDDDKLAVLAKVNRGEISQRKAGEMLGVSYTWVRDMTKRYFGRDGQRLTDRAEPEPDEWIPVIERVARGEISGRAASDELCVSDNRVNSMLAHLRGQATEPSIARAAMDSKLAEPDNADLYKKRSQTIEPVFGNIKANLGYRRFTVRGMPAVSSEWRLICTAHNLLKLRNTRLA